MVSPKQYTLGTRGWGKVSVLELLEVYGGVWYLVVFEGLLRLGRIGFYAILNPSVDFALICEWFYNDNI